MGLSGLFVDKTDEKDDHLNRLQWCWDLNG